MPKLWKLLVLAVLCLSLLVLPRPTTSPVSPSDAAAAVVRVAPPDVKLKTAPAPPSYAASAMRRPPARNSRHARDRYPQDTVALRAYLSGPSSPPTILFLGSTQLTDSQHDSRIHEGETNGPMEYTSHVQRPQPP